MRIRQRVIELFALLVLALAAALPAEANTVQMVDASYTIGPGAGPEISTLLLSGPGTLTVDLTSLPWPQPLADISFRLVTATGQLLGTMQGFGEKTFNIASPGLLFALSCGTPTPFPGQSFGYGSFGIEINFTTPQPPAVPLPQTALLLASGLALLGLSRPRGRFAIKV